MARSWGGWAASAGSSSSRSASGPSQHPAEKRRIAEAAAKLVADEALVGLTGGTTTVAVARAIADRRRLTVVTNSLSVGMQLAPRSNIRLIMSGGEARTASFELSGPLSPIGVRAPSTSTWRSSGSTGSTCGRAARPTTTPRRAPTPRWSSGPPRRSWSPTPASSATPGSPVSATFGAVSLIITDTAATDEQIAPFAKEGVKVEVERV